MKEISVRNFYPNGKIIIILNTHTYRKLSFSVFFRESETTYPNLAKDTPDYEVFAVSTGGESL